MKSGLERQEKKFGEPQLKEADIVIFC